MGMPKGWKPPGVRPQDAIGITEFAVLLFVALRVGRNTTCMDVAKRFGWTRTAAHKAVWGLVRKGLITRRKHKSGMAVSCRIEVL